MSIHCDLTQSEFLAELHNDLSIAEKCKQLLDQITDVQDQLLTSIRLEHDQSNVSVLSVTVQRNIEDIDSIIKQSDELTQSFEEEFSKIADSATTLKKYSEALQLAQARIQYTYVLNCIAKLNVEMQKEYCNNDDEKCATIFANICEISRNLSDSNALHLFDYIRNVLFHWHNVLRDKFAQDFHKILKSIKWPLDVDVSVVLKMKAPLKALQITTEYLLQIEMPEEHRKAESNEGVEAKFKTLCSPIVYMLQPLYKRFLYHFTGARQTNRIDKPEWYFTRILSWIRDHVDFIDAIIQPVADKLGLHHIDAKVEFMHGLVEIAIEKLNNDAPHYRDDEHTFSHTVDEVLAFDKELRETYMYPSTKPSILVVLTKGSVFKQWLQMERQLALEKMDGICNRLDIAFELLVGEDDKCKVTKCADTFITLLQTITERYESLVQPGHRLQFLEMQLGLLDDFRTRLTQLASDSAKSEFMESRIASIVNTSYHIENVLFDWGTMLQNLNLYHYLYSDTFADCEPQAQRTTIRFCAEDDLAESGTVFSGTLNLYRRMRIDLMLTLVDAVVLESQRHSNRYCSGLRWSAMEYRKDWRELSLTPIACPFFEVLARHLHQLQKYLAVNLFSAIWRDIALRVDVFLFVDMVLSNRFNDGGAMQLKFDIQRNLFPLFAQFCDKPENAFVRLHASCVLLNISKGSALLLRETLIALEGATGVEDCRPKALKEIGVQHFSPQLSIETLNRRTDITFNPMSPID